jgi:hypothetical protein
MPILLMRNMYLGMRTLGRLECFPALIENQRAVIYSQGHYVIFYTFYAVTLLEPGIYSGIERKNAALEKIFPSYAPRGICTEKRIREATKQTSAGINIICRDQLDLVPLERYNKFGVALSSSELTSSLEVILLLINAPFISA